MFTPDGHFLFNRIIQYLRAQYPRYGIEEVKTPSIWKKSLWLQSGHAQVYHDHMFGVCKGMEPTEGNQMIDEGVSQADAAYGLKPMNCPGHCYLFKAMPTMSFRDMPVRWAEFSGLHRNENAGSLTGMTRVRKFHQDDAHIFCRPDQVHEEILSTLSFIRETYSTFQLPEPTFVLSTRPDKYLGSLEAWNDAELALETALRSLRLRYEKNEGDGAFYGPKIDVNITDRNKKLHQLATIQLDFQLPERFELFYAGETPGSHERPVIIHRAVLGSLERFMALVMENLSGKWPFWLNPKQCLIVPIIDKDGLPEYAEYAKKVINGDLSTTSDPGGPVSRSGLYQRRFNIDLDLSKRKTLAQKIRQGLLDGYTFIAVVGHNDRKNGTLTLQGEGFPKKEIVLSEVRALFSAIEDEFR